MFHGPCFQAEQGEFFATDVKGRGQDPDLIGYNLTSLPGWGKGTLTAGEEIIPSDGESMVGESPQHVHP